MAVNSIHEFGFLRLDGRKKVPLFRQLYEQLRLAILHGRLKSNDRIPSSRDLMDQLRVSRTTVVTAIDLLIAEGYLHTERGKGTFVSGEIPDEQMEAANQKKDLSSTASSQVGYLSRYGKSVEASRRDNWFKGTPIPFCPGEPALDQFPVDVWSKIVRRICKSPAPVDLSYGDSAGYEPLRLQVAEYLRVHRGVNCEPEQVMIVHGTQQAVDIVARIALDPDDKVLFENPGYVSAREAFARHGANVVSMPVDSNGAMVRHATQGCPDARLAYVTPSHQFPLGYTLPVERRLELVQWAEANNSLIFEDDYDSEYRYAGRPLPSLQGLDRASRTIYVGSFSKVIFPALGLGYAIVPPPMIGAFQNALKLTSRSGSQIDQIVLSEFIREGHFVRHLRRMRKTHALRRAALVEELEKRLNDELEIIGCDAGLHCATLLRPSGFRNRVSDHEIVDELKKLKIVARPLSSYYVSEKSAVQKSTSKTKSPRLREDSKPKQGLVFGFACATPGKIRRRMKDVAEAINSM